MKNMFNIYYINNEKASEISMLFDNEIVEKITRIKNTEFVLAGDTDLKTSAASKIPVIGQYLPSVDLNGNLSPGSSHILVMCPIISRPKSSFNAAQGEFGGALIPKFALYIS